MFKTHQMLLLLFRLNKVQFWFLLMLKSSSVEVWQKETLQKKMQIAQPPRQGLPRLQMKDTRYNFVERLQCEFYALYV